jgi:hypothetical protein
MSYVRYVVGLGASRQGEGVRSYLLELIETGNVPRFTPQLADHLPKGNVRTVDQDGAHRRAQRADGLEQADPGRVVNASVDHHQVEILEATLLYCTAGIHGGTDVKGVVVGDVCHRRGATGVEINDQQTNGRIHRGVA